MKHLRTISSAWNHLDVCMCNVWLGDAHTLLLGAGSFIALMIAPQGPLIVKIIKTCIGTWLTGSATITRLI